MYGQICPGFISRILYKRASWNCAHLRGPKTKALKISIFIVIALTIFLYHIIAYGRFSDGIACFCTEIKDGIPDILDDHEHPPPKGKSIFFHETSCNKADGWIIQINARQACAVESAANLNPNSTVYLLYTSPIRYPNVSMFSSHKYKVLQELIKYKNIKIRRVDLRRYTQNTPLQNWFHTGQLNRSSYVNSHTSDVLRYLSLWRYGGTYMDLDVVLMKNLEKLKPNYAGAESQLSVAAGIINFDHHNVGHRLAELCLKEIEMNFKGEDWGYNGPGVITRVLNHICETKKTYAMTEERCKGFNVLPSSAFYPIHWRKWKLYFDTQRLDLALKQVNNSYAIHVWNKFSIDTTVYTRQSDVLYGNVARKYCPNVYKASGDTF